MKHSRPHRAASHNGRHLGSGKGHNHGGKAPRAVRVSWGKRKHPKHPNTKYPSKFAYGAPSLSRPAEQNPVVHVELGYSKRKLEAVKRKARANNLKNIYGKDKEQ